MSKFMQLYLEILLLVTAIFIIVYLFNNPSGGVGKFFGISGGANISGINQNLKSSVCFASPAGGQEKNCFLVSLAKTGAEQEKGLMYVKEMPQKSGMLFIFDKEAVYPFWMKNTLIPLDMIWIDANNKVVFIGKNVQPCKTIICPVTNPAVKAKYVLEINGGMAKELGIELSQEVKFEIK